MKTAFEHYHGLPEGLPELVKIRLWMDGLPDRPIIAQDGEGLWSCHAVVRAAFKKWNLIESGWVVQDGFFMRGWQHSWLYREVSSDAKFVLDIYPVASTGGPLLVDVAVSPWREFYAPSALKFTAQQQEFESEANELLGKFK